MNKNKLIELIDSNGRFNLPTIELEELADHLIANGIGDITAEKHRAEIKLLKEALDIKDKLLEAYRKENESLKQSLEKTNYAVNEFIEELAWIDIQSAAHASGMFNEACGQPSNAAIPTYRKHYDKMFENAKHQAAQYGKEETK